MKTTNTNGRWNPADVDTIVAAHPNFSRATVQNARFAARIALNQAMSSDQFNQLCQSAVDVAVEAGRLDANKCFVAYEWLSDSDQKDLRRRALTWDDINILRDMIDGAINIGATAYSLSVLEFRHQLDTEDGDGFVVRYHPFVIRFCVELIGQFVGVEPHSDDDRRPGQWYGMPHGDNARPIAMENVTDTEGPVNAEAATAYAMGVEIGKASAAADEGAVELQGMDREQSQDVDDAVGMWKAGETVAMEGRLYVSQGQHQIHGRDALDAIPCHCTADDCQECNPIPSYDGRFAHTGSDAIDLDAIRDPSSIRQDAIAAAPVGPNVGATTGYHLTRNEWPDGTVEVTLTVQVVKGTERQIMQRLAEVGAAIL